MMMMIHVSVVRAHIICGMHVQWPVREWKKTGNDKIVLSLALKNLKFLIYHSHIHSRTIQIPKAIIK